MAITRSLSAVCGVAGAITAGLQQRPRKAYVPAPRFARTVKNLPISESSRQQHNPVALRAHVSDLVTTTSTGHGKPQGGWLTLGIVGAFLLSMCTLMPASIQSVMVDHHATMAEDLFLIFIVGVTAYCLSEMKDMQMKCPHLQARVHTSCNFLATVCSLYGLAMERFFRESPDLWWAVLTPILYGISNLTMSQLMDAYKGPLAYRRLFELGQSFTLSFQGIHLLAWSSVYPALYWAALPFWYWSLKKLVEPVTYMVGVVAGDDAKRVKEKQQTSQSWSCFGMELDALTVIFMGINFLSALVDNTYMGIYTLRGPEGFFEASRGLEEVTGGWGSDHLRTALVKPSLGSLVLSMAVFLGTLCSRKRLPLAVGVPLAAVLSALGPWVVFFWHRLVDPNEPWLPELLGDHWGPAPLFELW
eukprot:CAMPEP_0172672602 /NCGR_PEP_ID=MMETSP1074-20121228/11647_1 /TAXON_ID=2916 /ORGANISM="Ceratium fusus, Strain PA161109" /LENGTH=415 /DNA_ID=CAMNT_0013489813 /DNA_START=26 /DNA_END=1273 /DNA_ORIENTATION=+